MIQVSHKKLELAKKHYFNLINKQNKNGEFHKTESLIGRINTALNNSKKAKEEAFWEYLLSNDLRVLKDLLIGNLEILKKYQKTIKEQFDKTLTASFKKHILEVLNYDNFRKSKKCKQLADWLDIKVCPYCNEHYTHTATSYNKSQKVVNLHFDFDHFIDKATHPYFSLSLYNLIPSCKICNSSCKGTEKFEPDTHIHPYKESFGADCKFSIEITDVDFITGNTGSIALCLEIPKKIKYTDKGKRIQRNINDLKLYERYQNHKDYALELIHKNIVYNEDYVNSLYQQYEGTLFKNREDVLRLISANYIEEQDLGKRPLAKLTSDIIEGLGLF